jgi:hypothetical protein
MEQVWSVIAFVSRCLSHPDVATEAREILDLLHAIERRVLELLARVPAQAQRRERLTEQTGEAWEPARHDRVESRALSRLQRELQKRGLLEP